METEPKIKNRNPTDDETYRYNKIKKWQKKRKLPNRAKQPLIVSESEKSDKSDNSVEWEVERIVGVKFNEDKSREFLVHWKGYDDADDSWEAEGNLNCPELLAKFASKVEIDKNPSRKCSTLAKRKGKK